MIRSRCETTDLAAAQPEILAEGQKRLAAWHEEMMRTMPFDDSTDPMDTVLAEGGPEHARIGHVPLKAYGQHLRDTGRGDWIKKIKERHPQIEM